MKITESKHHGTTLPSIVGIALFSVLLATGSSYAQVAPALDPPTAERTSSSITPQDERRVAMAPLAATTEWIYHRTADSKHPSGIEQRQLWFVNRARSNPTAEGIWLATESHSDVSGGRNYFGVDVTKLQNEFSLISAMPPAAFDRRLYEAARVHSKDLITRDAQDHNNQFDRVTAADFSWRSLGGVVFSYTKNGLQAHAAFNIDWGNEADGMQSGRGHRVALMSDGKEFTNVGIASIHVSDDAKNVGPYVTTGNYAKANVSEANHFNAFIVGTVWSDSNSNGWYDDGEGIAGVTVTPDIGTYYATTADSGGYAIPITETGAVTLIFSGAILAASGTQSTTLSTESILVDFIPSQAGTFYRDADGDRYGDAEESILVTTRPDGYVLDNTDCDDSRSDSHPGASETAGDEIDQDCNKQELCYTDFDDDGYRPNATSTIASANMECTDSGEAMSTDPLGDCNDYDVSIHPGAIELVGDAIDQDCNTQELCYADFDNDGYRTDETNTVVSMDLDCTDTTEAIPSAPVGDCDDSSFSVHPEAIERCDNLDNNCDGNTDEGVRLTWYLDRDGDTYGDILTTTKACTPPSKYVADNTDCNDLDPIEHPDQSWYQDLDGDGYSNGTTNSSSCTRPVNYYAASELKQTSGDPDDADSNKVPSQFLWNLFLPAIIGTVQETY